MKINIKQKFILKVTALSFVASFIFGPTEICSGYVCTPTGSFDFIWQRNFGEKIHYLQLLLFWALITICSSILIFVAKHDRDLDTNIKDSKSNNLKSVNSSLVEDSSLHGSLGDTKEGIFNSLSAPFSSAESFNQAPAQTGEESINKYFTVFVILAVGVIFFLGHLVISATSKFTANFVAKSSVDAESSINLINLETKLLRVKSDKYWSSEIYFGEKKIVAENDLARWGLVEISDQIVSDKNKIDFVAKLQFNAWAISNDLLFVTHEKKSGRSEKIFFESSGSAIKNISVNENGEISVVLEKIIDEKRMKINFSDGKIYKSWTRLTSAETEEACHQLYGFFKNYSISEKVNFVSNTATCNVRDFSDLAHIWELRGVDYELFDQLKDGNFFDKERFFRLASISCSQKLIFKEPDFKNAVCKST
jgi:hypothetical protein